MSGLRMFLELRECKARSNSVSEGAKYLIDTYIIIYDEIILRKQNRFLKKRE